MDLVIEKAGETLKPKAHWQAARKSGGRQILFGLLFLVGGGCIPPSSSDPGLPDGNRDTSVTSPLGKTSGEPNGTFAAPIVAVFDDQNVARLQGNVAARGDIDVFMLGELSAGDRVEIDVAAPNSVLDASIALYDPDGRLVYANDDREDGTLRALDPTADWIARRSGMGYFVVISHSAFAPRGRFTGSYMFDVRVTPGQTVPAPLEQIVVLDFDGAVITSPVLGTFSLDPFDAARIDPVYEGQTEEIMQGIRDVFAQNYGQFNVTVRTSDDPPLPAGTQFSSVYFGGFDPGAFGLAETVDLYNVEFCDDAIIYAESFTVGPAGFSFRPSAAELAIAIANVAAHESGHLLGLNHVDNDLDLMDARSHADAFLEDQEFLVSPVSTDIIPIGVQDSVLLLNDTVGPREEEPM